MNAKDTIQLGHWIASRASLAEVESIERIGLVGNERFSERARRRFILLWHWCDIRLSSDKQDAFWNLHGKDAFYRRMARARRMARFYGAKFKDDPQ